MRGRAIRTDRNNPDKTANIWHLICIDPTAENGGDDLQHIKRRFKSFVGISNREDVSIENGIHRLNIPEYLSIDEILSYRNEIIRNAGRRDLLKEKWKEALSKGVVLTEEIKVPFLIKDHSRK